MLHRYFSLKFIKIIVTLVKYYKQLHLCYAHTNKIKIIEMPIFILRSRTGTKNEIYFTEVAFHDCFTRD